jgi:SAM-dependent methyltransferase
MEDIYSQAINPKQYDTGKIQWEQETGESPMRKFFFGPYISQFKDFYKDKSVLDIGCGTGWLLPKLSDWGAKQVEGLEPSKVLREVCKKIAPDYKVHNKDFLSFNPKNKYDAITGIMVLIHIGDINKAFQKANSLLNKNGELHIIVPDYDYFRRERIDYKVEFKDINPDEYATLIHRPIGAFADVVRRSRVYEKIAKENGLKLVSDTPMYPTPELINAIPKYKEFEKVVMMHLLRFKKIS